MVMLNKNIKIRCLPRSHSQFEKMWKYLGQHFGVIQTYHNPLFAHCQNHQQLVNNNVNNFEIRATVIAAAVDSLSKSG